MVGVGAMDGAVYVAEADEQPAPTSSEVAFRTRSRYSQGRKAPRSVPDWDSSRVPALASPRSLHLHWLQRWPER